MKGPINGLELLDDYQNNGGYLPVSDHYGPAQMSFSKQKSVRSVDMDFIKHDLLYTEYAKWDLFLINNKYFTRTRPGTRNDTIRT